MRVEDMKEIQGVMLEKMGLAGIDLQVVQSTEKSKLHADNLDSCRMANVVL